MLGRIQWRKGTGLLLAVACLVMGRLQAQQPTGPAADWQSKILSNGMSVRYRQDSTRSLLHLGLTMRGGASIDVGDQVGVSRLYEQLFFQYLTAGIPATSAADAGIFLSHKTLLESHFFGMSLPPAQLPAALHLLQAGLSATEWADSTLDVARKAIGRDMQTSDNAPEEQLMTDMASHLWASFASGKQAMARYGDLLRIGTQQIVSAVAPYRHPGNCELDATGPQDPQAFWDQAEANLGSWRPESAGAMLPKVEMPKLTQSIYFQTVNEFVPQPLIMMAWPVDRSDDPDGQSRDAMHFCELAHLKQGLMYQHLVDSGLALDYTWSWAGGLNPGQLLLYVIPDKDRFAECVQAVQREIAQMGNANRFSKEEVATANRQLRLAAAKRDDQSIPRLLEAGHAWLLSSEAGGDPGTVSPASMQAFARAYVQGRPHVAGLLINSTLIADLAADSVFTAPTGSGAIASVAPVPTPKDGKDSLPPPTKYIDAATLARFRVYFVTDEGVPDVVSSTVLADVAAMLRTQPQKRIFLNSFSQGLGDGVKNYQWSIARAKQVRSLLVEQMGVAAQQIVLRAYGEAFPEIDDDNSLKNRRISFEFAPPDAQDNAF